MSNEEFSNKELSNELYSKLPYPSHPSAIKYVEDIAKKFLLDHININSKVLMLGCGSGEEVIGLSSAFKFSLDITAIEPVAESYNLARNLCKNYTNIKIYNLDMINFFKSNNKEKWDFIWCSGVLHHTNNPEENLKAISQHIKPEGKLYLGFYHNARWKITYGSDESLRSKAMIEDINSHPIEITKNWTEYRKYLLDANLKITNVCQKYLLPAPKGIFIEKLYDFLWNTRKIHMMSVIAELI